MSDIEKAKKLDAILSVLLKNANNNPEKAVELALRLLNPNTAIAPKSLQYEDLVTQEKEINDKAQVLAKKLGVVNCRFVIYLNPSDDGTTFRISRGTTVSIYLCILPAHPDFDRVLRDAIKNVPKFKIPSELVNRKEFWSWTYDGSIRKLREKYKDIADILPMLPMHRISTEVESVYTVTDTVTGESETVSTKDFPLDTPTQLRDRARYKLSRKVLMSFENEDFWDHTSKEPDDSDGTEENAL